MENSRKQGVWHLFYDNGKFMGEANFENGYGKYNEFYDNGKVKMSGYIAGNDYTGEWMYYYDDGTLEGECFYLNGEGDYLGYYTDGSKKMSGRLKNGKKIGIWKLYDLEGSLSGLYKSYFDADDEKTQVDTAARFAISSPTSVKKGSTKKTVKVRYLQFYKARVNEKQAVIVGLNPVAPLFFSLPVSLELYFEKRIGYELGFILQRRPFAESHTYYLSQLYNATVVEGGALYLRQKLYFGRKKPDTYYLSQEFRISNLEYRESARSYDADSMLITTVKGAKERKYEVSLLLGKRVFIELNKGRLAVDIFGGIGLGFRDVRGTKDINEIPTNKLTLPLRLGAMIGYEY